MLAPTRSIFEPASSAWSSPDVKMTLTLER